MKLTTISTPGVVSAARDSTLAQVAALMKSHNVGAVVIAEDRRPVGILTDRDLALALGADGKPAKTPAGEVMSHPVLAVPDDTDFLTATRHLRDRKVRRLPIVDSDDRLVGMVTLDDLLRALGHELVNLSDAIQDEVRIR